MKQYVLDTSVVVKWFSSDEEDSGKALNLRDQLYEGLCDITVPDLAIYELANALKYNPYFTAQDVKNALNSIFDMGIETKEVDSVIINEAIGIAYRFNVTVYDAYFLALSRREKKQLVTADYKFFELVKSFKGIIRLSGI